MQFRIPKELLLRGLTTVQGVVETKKTLPVLSHILLEAKKGGVSLFGTDLDIGINSQIEAEVFQSGAVSIPGRRLYEIIRELPESIIDIEADQDCVVSIHCNYSEFRLKGLPKEEFPSFPEPKREGGHIISRETLWEMIQKTIFAVSTDQTRYTLTGVLFQILPEEFRMVATDGHRLALVKKDRGEIKGVGNWEALVPKKALSELLKMLRDEGGEVGIRLIDNQIVFDLQREVLMARLIEGQFPNYEQVIPGFTQRRVLVKRALLSGALRRTTAILGERIAPTKLDIFQDRMVVSCVNQDLGEAKETLEIEYQGDEISMGFNAKYILDFLNVAFGEDVVIHFSDPLSPTLYRVRGDEGYTCIIMPMRL